MTKTLSAIAIAVTLFFPPVSQADWIEGKVSSVYPLANGGVIINLINDGGTCLNNPGGTPYYYLRVGRNGMTPAGVKTIYATVLTAFAMDKPIGVHFDAASDGCDVNRVRVVN